MDIFDILREAKNPSSSPKVITVRSNNTDYTEDLNNDEADEDTSGNEENYDDQPRTDYTEDVITEPSESTDDNDEDTEPTDDSNEDPEYSQQPDYSDDVDNDTSDENPEEGDNYQNNPEQEETVVDPEDAKQNSVLISNSVDLYYSIKSVLTRLNGLTNINISANYIIIQVNTNLTKLKNQLYDFIVYSSRTNTYVKNIYTYNLFIESYKISIEMLRKINLFQ